MKRLKKILGISTISAICLTTFLSFANLSDAYTFYGQGNVWPSSVRNNLTYARDGQADAIWNSGVVNWNNKTSKVKFVNGFGGGYVVLYTVNKQTDQDGYCTVYATNKAVSVATHELGHVLGLGDLYGSYPSLMNGHTNTRYDNYGIYTPQQDDLDGINVLY